MATKSVPLESLSAPKADNPSLTSREKIILLQSAKLHGCVFPPWTTDPADHEFQDLFEDGTDFRLADAQGGGVFDRWIRSSEAQIRAYGAREPRLDLVQDVTNDCSVVASLCVLSARAERLQAGQSPSLFPSMYPQGRVSANGKYIFKLHFNGSDRKVVVDDRLPKSKTAGSMHVFDRTDAEMLWPALIEKAYLKVRGGYDFLGSNSGTDLWVLCGWIPEQVFLHDDEVDLPALWKKVLNAHYYGDVLITIGTGKLTDREEEVFGIASEHAYAVLELREESGRRQMLVKNPWVDGKAWPRTPAAADTDGEQGEEETPGVFWIDLNDALQYFETMHLNWNPGLFRYRRDCHFTWDLAMKSGPGSFLFNPQYLVRSEKGGTVWLLLNKHFQSRNADAPPPSPGHPPAWPVDFVSLHLFESAYRVSLAEGSTLRTAYVDSHHVLLRAEFKPNTSYTAVISEQDARPVPTHFTLAAFSLNPLNTFEIAPHELPHVVSITSAWRTDSAGGNVTHASYATNPQFALQILGDAPLLLLTLETPNADTHVHFKVLWLGGRRVTAPLAARDVLADSGDYRRGCAAARVPSVPAGTYTVVVSTFEQGQLGEFTISVRVGDAGCELRMLPPAEAGRLSTRLPVAVFGPGVNRLLTPLEVARVTRLSLRARHAGNETVRRGGGSDGGGGSTLRLALEHGQGPNTRVLTEAQARGGSVATTDVDLSPAQCALDKGPGVWLVVEREGPAGGAERLEVEALATERGVSVGVWGRASDVPIEELMRRMEVQGRV